MSEQTTDLRAVAVGDQLPGRTIHLTREDLVRYAGASLDRNRIHWDEPFAKQVGLPDVIAHGMLTMGSAVQVVVDWVGDAGRVVEYATKFTAPVVVDYDDGADVEVSGTVKKVEGDRATVELTATCRGQKVLGRALATVRLDG
ncbi:MaoC family dehydratase N-terminal domain-containing protein [Arsenicicoccus piscis]|uniref:MaoC family dehydratase n=1 Tax=Arsenicicoccus piscis TaxID=673954 RepID=A0ABQ6HIC1_9MICO|nr:MaoC/PaaZ C-terminal domain-containing protein [Arsenicicoccus piscis]MCH8627767.1 MaoC family dehydratase N-terminal domain-containing protein [Arsenicicoccus piscis]GMA18283.1 MaoC family dehydratase [Arsenicicoccus piscis]